jgi:diacylglycerol O-acyltransferase / wax synthase
VQQLTGADASFLYFDTPKVPGHVFSLWLYDPSTAPGGKVTFKGILDHYQHRLHVARMFRQKLVHVPMGLDHPYWINDADFDLEFHVRHIALPKPGDWRQLCIQAARLHSRPLDLSRPPWEATVIEGLDNVEGLPPGSFAVMQKTHHAAVDGITMFEIISAIHDREPEATPPAPTEEWKPEREPTPWELLVRAAFNNASAPLRFAQLMSQALPGNRERMLQQELELPSMSPAPRTRFSGPVSGHRVLEGCRFDLAELKRIKSTVEGATVNDAVIAIVGGALRTYLSKKGELPEEPLRCMVPISLRPPGEPGSAGNQVGAMVASLATDVEHPRDRLAAVRESTHRSKRFNEAIDAHTLSKFSELVPGGLAMMGARVATQFEMATRTAPIVNTVVSNVPGPQVPLYLAGARLVTMFGGAAVADGMGIFHGVISYCGEVIVTITSDRDMLPDPADYAACLRASYEEMSAATS